MYRLLVVLRHTFQDTVVQPIYPVLLALGAMILGIFGALPFFTLGEDTKMFKDVGLDVIMILALISTLFATSKSIYEEIEDRTMLTLMSKPVHRWEVLVGKYLGIILATLLSVAILGLVIILCTWWRIPGDYQIRTNTLDENSLKNLFDTRWMHVMGLVPSLLAIWLQVSVLAAIGVAISTRLSLVVNLPAVLLIYVAGNLTRFLAPLNAAPADAAAAAADGGAAGGGSALVRGLAYVVSLVLPYLELFDLRQLTVYSTIALAGTRFEDAPDGVSLATIWASLGTATLYAIAYSLFALAIGMLLFQNRELGGAEG